MVFCVSLTLILVGTVVCCFWLKKADLSRQRRVQKEAEARARQQRLINMPCSPVNEELLTVPQVGQTRAYNRQRKSVLAVHIVRVEWQNKALRMFFRFVLRIILSDLSHQEFDTDGAFCFDFDQMIQLKRK